MARAVEPTLRAAPEDAFQQEAPIRYGMGDQVFVRIFKQEGQLELWLRKSNSRFSLYKTYPICKWSGRLGPKLKEADYQSPEGFYSVSAKQLHPHSNYHRAFNVGYPNAFDRQNGRTGGLVMVHGACKSVGCFAMTDRGIEEIYAFVEAAMRAGQHEVQVHIFPFRLTEQAIARETGGSWLAFVGAGGNYQHWTEFWRNLKQGYDHLRADRRTAGGLRLRRSLRLWRGRFVMPTHRRLVIVAHAETLFSLVSAGAREDALAKALGGASKETPACGS